MNVLDNIIEAPVHVKKEPKQEAIARAMAMNPEEFFEHPKNERIRQFIRKVGYSA